VSHRGSFAAAVACALFVAPGMARAGTYPVTACSAAPGSVNNSFVAFNSDPAHLSVGQSCPPLAGGSTTAEQESGLYATDRLLAGSNAIDGATAGWRFTAAQGTTVVSLAGKRYLGAHGDEHWTPFISADDVDQETCAFAFPADSCQVGAPFGSGEEADGPRAVPDASTVTVGITCAAAIGCGTGGTMHEAWATLYGVTLTVSEAGDPALATPTAGLWGEGAAGGFHVGTESVSVIASDVSGISSAQLSVDGVQVASSPGVCDYTKAAPCGNLHTTLSFNTAAVGDGPHTLSLQVDNAAQNVSQSSHEIVVDNTAPAAPEALSLTREASGAFALGWRNPPGQVAPIVASTYEFCAASGACLPPVSGGAAGLSGLRAPTGIHSVRVWLIDAAGHGGASNASAIVVPTLQPGEGKHVAALRLTHRLHGRRLTLSVNATGNVRGPVTVAYVARRGKRRTGHASRKVKLRGTKANATFTLSRVALAAQIITVSASAAGAPSVTAMIRLLRRRAPRR
jgi:hypothetical protein